MERYQEIERSIIKKYRKEIWSKFVKAIMEYQLIQENDRIMVCISGGKDSFLLAKCIQELQRHGKYPFEAIFVVMDPGYQEEHKKQIFALAKDLQVPIEMFSSNVFEVAQKKNPEHPCYLCARMRRGCLYGKAKELGCNKIALGHHFDDVIETTLLSMFYSSEIRTMLPKLHSENFSGLELIRPLYFVKEASIVAWARTNHLEFLQCACTFTKSCDSTDSKRVEIKKLIQVLREKSPLIDYNIFKSIDNINLNCVLGYIKDGEKHSFLDEYDKDRS